MPVHAKICGVSTPDALDAAIGGGATHVGFVLFAPSPRDVSPDRLAALSARTPGHVRRVAVMVDPDDALIAAAAPHVDVFQLHKATPARAAALRSHAWEVWTAVAVKTRFDVEQARGYVGAADRILYDAKTPDAAALPGGMGLRFDWTLLDGVDHPLPWALSGGLDASNVAAAATRTGARLVDVSSGVESAPGVKDVDKIAAFLQAIGRL